MNTVLRKKKIIWWLGYLYSVRQSLAFGRCIGDTSGLGCSLTAQVIIERSAAFVLLTFSLDLYSLESSVFQTRSYAAATHC